MKFVWFLIGLSVGTIYSVKIKFLFGKLVAFVKSKFKKSPKTDENTES